MRRYGEQHRLKFILAKFDMRFPTMWYVQSTKPHISLRIHAVWSAQSDQSISKSLAYSISVKAAYSVTMNIFRKFLFSF